MIKQETPNLKKIENDQYCYRVNSEVRVIFLKEGDVFLIQEITKRQ
ncbi:hypothetical protein LDG_6884 [Legionella drancourtii LLAP12]|uniref:Uncharacterized protein n=1 Tax=Legionella drancourtii LLAP12 TaxID=658187 RepID=G9ENQ8_9GAMM|nr:hypothetical protein LDG_6884 [Legionella drancourtii LLAP12]